MRKLLNTLHVMTQGAYLHRDGETVAIKVGDELEAGEFPCIPLKGWCAGAGCRAARRYWGCVVIGAWVFHFFPNREGLSPE